MEQELQEQIRYLKTNYPRMSASAIYRQLQDNGSIRNGGVSESTVNRYINLMSVMKSAVAKYGRPQMFNFDNGSSFKNKQMELLAARISSVIHYDQPYTPTQKAKIER